MCFYLAKKSPVAKTMACYSKKRGKILNSVVQRCHPESGIAGCPQEARKDGKKETFKKGRNRHDNIAAGILRPHERDIRQGI